MKKILYILLLVIIISLLYFFIPAQTTPKVFDSKNSTFSIGDMSVTLTNGISEITTEVNTKVITQYFGNEARGDVNLDSKEDVVFLVSVDSGGTGFFTYAIAALQTDAGYQTTDAFFIGDRIAPQTTEINSQTGEIHVNFAGRGDVEPMSVQPSHGKVAVLKVTEEGTLEGYIK